MDSTQSPAAFKALNTQLSASTQRMDELVANAAKAGAVMEGDFKKKIFDASQTVNGFTERIIAQKAVVKDIEADVKHLGEAYRTALKRNPLSANSKLNEYNSARKALDEEKAALFGLTQEQANARLSVKKLRDEYSLYKDDAKGVTETNNGIAISWKKALAVIGGVSVLKALGSELIRVRGEFQSMQTAIETIVGKDTAGQLIPQIKWMQQLAQILAKHSDGTLGGLGGRSGSLPRLLCVLALDLLLLQIPGHRAALLHFRVFLHGLAVVIIRCGLDVLVLGTLHDLCWVFPDGLAELAPAEAVHGLRRQLGTVCALRADIFMLDLIELAMHKAVDAVSGGVGKALDRTGLFRRLLFCQLLPGGVQLLAPALHPQLGCRRLLLPALSAEFGLRDILALLTKSRNSPRGML